MRYTVTRSTENDKVHCPTRNGTLCSFILHHFDRNWIVKILELPMLLHVRLNSNHGGCRA